ncbi:immunity 53 family protein [Paraflavitalea speifideaquila]|uniref:immunity 53 family protein n=1 Tax=Paraflavitalea speifideaquila TaxID=3076558 RepID=UPI0028ED1A35|nr:immunity 53 family protein [Paraflavitalea speifideiaquila]
MEKGILTWLQEWYESHCDSEREHEYGITINTIDNPGWYITIDLAFTKLESIELEGGTVENGEDDWYFYKINNKQYKASGDCSKLEFLLLKFREIVENN